MRIAVINHSLRKIAGAETYIEAVLGLLSDRGHVVGLWAENDEPAQSPPIHLPSSVASWCASRMGVKLALEALAGWRPSVIYSQKLLEPETEAAILRIAPALFFSHDYYGTCISGLKSFMFPTGRPCHRRFGPPCLLHYYPRRCGGLSPVTMLRDYQRQSARLASLARYAGIAVASEHMAAEYRRHGLRAEVLPYIQEGPPEAAAIEQAPPEQELRLFFMGRMEKIKGGQLLLDALPRVAGSFPGKVRCDFAGVGSQEARWKARADALMARHDRLGIHFHGWLGATQRQDLLLRSHLLIVPSIWPEPFGLVGHEAGMLGVPAVAFDVGGISAWLKTGENGMLAPGEPPRAGELAEAIVAAVSEPRRYQRLRAGALERARAYKAETHIMQLESMLSRIA